MFRKKKIGSTNRAFERAAESVRMREKMLAGSMESPAQRLLDVLIVYEKKTAEKDLGVFEDSTH